MPGIAGLLELDPARTVIASYHRFGKDGFERFEIQIPGAAALVGKHFYWQTFYVNGRAARFGNVQEVVVK